VLQGGMGDDTLIGGVGADTLTGGGGNDTFVFRSAAETPPGVHRDHITDFTPGQDVVDLTQLDAAAGVTGTFIGTSAFSHSAGEVHYYYHSGHTIIAGDTNGDGTADYKIELDTHVVLGDTDFLL